MAARLALALIRAALRATALAVTALMVGACAARTAGQAESGIGAHPWRSHGAAVTGSVRLT